MSALLVGLLVLGSTGAHAQNLALPELPPACRYISNVQQTLTSQVQISASTPLFSEIGDAQREILNMTLQCEGPLNQPVSFSVHENGPLEWLGPGRDILATNIPGVGVRLRVDANSESGNCTNSDWISSGKPFSCTLYPASRDAKTLRLSLKAQLVKIGHNTPFQSHTTMRLARGGALALQGKAASESSFDIMGNGLIAPIIATTASCELITEKEHNVRFGQINRPKGETNEKTLGTPQATRIEVACLPLRDESVNDYQVNITFNASTLHGNDASALSTSIDDMAIRFARDAEGNSWSKFGEKYSLNHWAAGGKDKSYFADTFYWFLRYIPGAKHHQTGEFNAVATYTIIIQ
ncbi:fimbrial protein [Pantoea dispersa]|uniref:fimbrial protein n=1 Tax=Pantoea dispersa TaxID=59814 RepID=UPI002DBB83FB|nr:fimbrial protein [Pantoea dispersa]MEB5974306.1 fimbrial protein [Pantoea dispersa]